MRFKRVLLVLGYGSGVRSDKVPLTLGYLAEALSRRGIEYVISHVDFRFDERKLLKKIKDFNPDLVGVSMTSLLYLKNYALISKIKKEYNVPVIIGGAHIRAERDLAMTECKGLDFALLGDGETALVELCEGKDFRDIKGLYYRDSGNVKFSGYQDYDQDLDELGFPKYKNFNFSQYKNSNVPFWMPLSTSRGCPFNCIYCSNPDHGQPRRYRSATNVVDEIEYWVVHKGFREFAIRDANFIQERERVLSICSGIKKRGLQDLKFFAGARPDLVDYELLQELKSVGLTDFCLNFDGSNDKTLAALNRTANMASFERGVKIAFDLKLRVHTAFLLGIPGQNWQDIEDMFGLLRKYRFSTLNFLGITPIRGTKVFDWVTENKLLFRQPKEYLNYSNMRMWGGICYETKDLSKKEIKKAIRIGFSFRDKYHYEEKLEQYAKYGHFLSIILAIASTIKMRALRRKVLLLNWARKIIFL